MLMAARRPTLAAIALPAILLLASAPGLDAAGLPATPTPSHREVLQSPAGITEVGLLDGAAYRIDIPAHWNHSLVVFYHGYALQPVTFHIAARLVGQEIAEATRILYGGSVKPDNAEALLSQPEIDGALVGGASLDPQSFATVVKAGVAG